MTDTTSNIMKGAAGIVGVNTIPDLATTNDLMQLISTLVITIVTIFSTLKKSKKEAK